MHEKCFFLSEDFQFLRDYMAVIFISALLILTGSATLAVCQESSQNMGSRNIDPVIAECLSGGHKAASEGNFDQAIKLFTACVEKHPKSVDAHFFLGMAYFRKKDIENATGQFKKASQLDPNNLDVTLMLGRLYSADKQKLGLARELLERVLAAAPYKDDARFDLARVYALSGEEKKSLEEFKRIFAHEPSYAVYHTEFAKILIAAGEKKGARSQLVRALALAPDFEPAKKLLESLDKEDQTLATPAGKKTP